MKTSELIQKLQKLEQEIPFDAEVVTGDDWQPSELVRVQHEPPYTFLEFEGIGEQEQFEEAREFSDTQLPLVGAYLSSLLHRVKDNPSTIDDVSSEILSFVVFCQANSPSEVFEVLKRLGSDAPG